MLLLSYDDSGRVYSYTRHSNTRAWSACHPGVYFRGVYQAWGLGLHDMFNY